MKTRKNTVFHCQICKFVTFLLPSSSWLLKLPIRFFHQSHNTVLFGGLFTLKQWIISSLKHDTVPRVNKLYCFYVKNPPKRIALWDRENSQFRREKLPEQSFHQLESSIDVPL